MKFWGRLTMAMVFLTKGYGAQHCLGLIGHDDLLLGYCAIHGDGLWLCSTVERRWVGMELKRQKCPRFKYAHAKCVNFFDTNYKRDLQAFCYFKI